ncbi:hypothetical protein GCM10027168_20270 [Streptomyces capparidis]
MIVARISRTLLPLVALLVALLGLPGTASAASAAPIAYNTKTQWLTADPDSSLPQSCVQRRITLASGHYDWGIIGAAERPDLYLGAGGYTWKDCLTPEDGYYIQQSSLDPDNPAWQTIFLTDYWFLADSQTMQWGSYLDPHF